MSCTNLLSISVALTLTVVTLNIVVDTVDAAKKYDFGDITATELKEETKLKITEQIIEQERAIQTLARQLMDESSASIKRSFEELDKGNKDLASRLRKERDDLISQKLEEKNKTKLVDGVERKINESVVIMEKKFRAETDVKVKHEVDTITARADLAEADTYNGIKQNDDYMKWIDRHCPRGWIKIPNKCIKVFYKFKMPWKVADKECERYGLNGGLATIDNGVENIYMREILREKKKKTKCYWFGLSDLSGKDNWLQGNINNHKNATYFNWKKGQPNGRHGTSKCGCIGWYTNDLWVDEHCATSYDFICQFDQTMKGGWPWALIGK